MRLMNFRFRRGGGLGLLKWVLHAFVAEVEAALFAIMNAPTAFPAALRFCRVINSVLFVAHVVVSHAVEFFCNVVVYLVS